MYILHRIGSRIQTYALLSTIHLWQEEGRDPVEKEGCIALHKQDPKPLKEVAGHLVLIPASVPGHGPGNLPDLFYSQVVPSSQGLDWEWDEDNPLGFTGLEGLSALVGEGLGKGVAGRLGGLCHPGGKERADHCHIQCSIFPTRPVRDEHVSRPVIVPREKCLLFLPRDKISGCRRLIKGIPKMVVAGDPLTLRPTDDGMITECITLLTTSWARPTDWVDGCPQPVQDGEAELLRADMKT